MTEDPGIPTPSIVKTYYSYIEDSGGHLWVCNVKPTNGSLSNCTTTGDSNHWNPDGTMTFIKLGGVSYGYVSDGNGLVWSCALSASTGLTTQCNLNSPGVGQPAGVRVLDLGTKFEAYIADASSGSLHWCTVDSTNGTLEDGCTSYNPVSWAANDINFASIGSTTFAFIADLSGSIWKCSIDSTSGALSGCAQVSSNYNWGSPFQLSFQAISGSLYVYVADLTQGFVSCLVNTSTGNFSECQSNPTGITGSYPSSIVLSTAGGSMQAYITSSDSNTWRCSVNQSSGLVSGCSINDGEWTADAALQGLSFYSP